MEQRGGLGNDRNWDYFFGWFFGGRSAIFFSIDTAGTVSFVGFQRGQLDHFVSLRRAGNFSVSLSVEFDSGAALFGDGDGSGCVAVDSADVFAFAMVGWIDHALWAATTVDGWPGNRGGGIRAVCGAGRGRKLLDFVFSGIFGVGIWNGGERSAVDDRGDGCGGSKPGGDGFGD